jgi:hypothetical protein
MSGHLIKIIGGVSGGDQVDGLTVGVGDRPEGQGHYRAHRDFSAVGAGR